MYRLKCIGFYVLYRLPISLSYLFPDFYAIKLDIRKTLTSKNTETIHVITDYRNNLHRRLNKQITKLSDGQCNN